MAFSSPYLIDALRSTANRLEAGETYMWAHMGRCNCGHLAQTLTGLTAEDIHKRALQRHGDWTEQSEHFEPYCRLTGFHLDYVMDALIESGLHPTDIRELETLANREVLQRLPGGFRYLERNRRDNVILYMRVWADLLEEKLPADAVVSGEVPEEESLRQVAPSA